jgi:hypothetical protein
MGSYNLDELITLWERDKLTTEQAVGQILLMLRSLSQQIRELEPARISPSSSINHGICLCYGPMVEYHPEADSLQCGGA